MKMDPWESCRLPDDISYEQWLLHIFDHPVLDPQWWWQEPESGYFQWWDDSSDPARTLSFLTQFFEEPEHLIGRFSRAQINQGLSYLVDNSSSNHMYCLTESKLPWTHRRRCFDAMISLYAKLMAPVYQNDLSHTQFGIGDPERPTYACYMWWDVIPLYGGMEHVDIDEINEAVLNVFEHVLKLKAESCLESALHGLGHWALYISERTTPIARRFLGRTDLSPALRQYAKYAEQGEIQ